MGKSAAQKTMGGLRRGLETGAIRTHFYPEGGWGWIVCACAFLAHVTTSGAQLSAGALHIVLANKFQDSTAHHWLGPVSWSVSSVFSPLVVNLCRRKNVRVVSLIGGILFPLSLLFTSFATELHQIFFSFGLIGGIGSCIVRESSGVVLGEFFRKRRQFVEQVVMAGTGVGVTLFSLLYLSFTRHLEWGVGFRVGAAFACICALLPVFYRNASKYQPRDRGGSGGQSSLLKHQRVESPKSPTSMVIPIGGDICRSLQLFCVPSLKPLLWSSAISSFGLYAPVFLMSDFGRKENLSGGSLLLLQTHLGLGLSLGVILGAILTLKKFRFCQLSPRVLCTCTACLTGLSMIMISSVKGYYGYSLSAWIYGVALGSHLYTLKVLTMELTRTKHWGRIWSCVQSIMSPGILLGSGLTSYAGKPGFYACATAVLIGAGLLGFQLIDTTKCSSPQLSSSVENDSPIPPAPPPISLAKYGHQATPLLGEQPMGFYPLRKSISLQQPVYPCCREAGEFGGGVYAGPGLGSGYPPGYSPYCRECVLSGSPVPPWGMYYQATPTGTMIRSYSLPQTGPIPNNASMGHLKTTGTQTNPNSPVRGDKMGQGQISLYPGSYDRLPTLPGTFLPQDRVIRDVPKDKNNGGGPSTSAAAGGATSRTFRDMPSYKNTVMFASNPQLFPASASSATSTTDRSATPTYSNGHNHIHNHNHNHHHPPPRNFRDPEPDDSNRSSPRHYYPQKEERRANFVKSHQSQKQFDSLAQQEQKPHPQRYQPTVVTVETHKKPSEPPVPIPTTSNNNAPKQQPAFTRHYFDSSKICKGSAAAASRNIFTAAPNNGNSVLSPAITKSVHPHNPSRAPNAQQKPVQSSLRQTQPTLPISITAINAKLQQYQRQQEQKTSAPLPPPSSNKNAQEKEVDWRSIQRQSITSSANPFENDPDPPYYPAALSHAQSHAYGQPQKGYSSTKVSGNEFDVEQPKFNSLRRSLSRSGQNSSVSSQLNYSITPTPVHHQYPPHTAGAYHHPPQQHQPHVHQHPQQHPQQFHPQPGPGASYHHPYYPPQPHPHHQHFQRQHQDLIIDRRRQGNVNDNINNSHNDSRNSSALRDTEDCPYCDPRGGGPPPPLSLSVPALQQSDPHYMCHYGYAGGQSFLRRRNTWHHHRDQLEAITTSV